MTVIHKRRVVEKIYSDGTCTYIPQHRFLGIWFSYYYDDLMDVFDSVREYKDMGDAIDFIKNDLRERQQDDLRVVWGYGSKAKKDRG